MKGYTLDKIKAYAMWIGAGLLLGLAILTIIVIVWSTVHVIQEIEAHGLKQIIENIWYGSTP